MDGIFTSQSGIFWKIIWWLFAGNYIKKAIRKLFLPTDMEAVDTCRMKLRDTVKRIDQILANKQTKYLSGSDTEPGIADIALASLIAPLVDAPGYCNGILSPAFAAIAKNDPDYVTELQEWRSTQTGQFAIELYRNFR